MGQLLKVEGINQKTKNVILLQFSWVTKVAKGVWVYALSFRRKIWTKGWWYFLLVALYYCKMEFSSTSNESSLPVFNGQKGRGGKSQSQVMKMSHQVWEVLLKKNDVISSWRIPIRSDADGSFSSFRWQEPENRIRSRRLARKLIILSVLSRVAYEFQGIS